MKGPKAATPRTGFDDVDDYDGWSSTPPQDRSGTVRSDLAGWTREVSVKWVKPADPTGVTASDEGVKRIIVTVKKDGVVLAQQFVLRTDKYEEPN